MNEFKGTRGKWEVVAQNETGALITGMNGNESICTVWGSVDEFEANAKLIACAPEMLELLIRLSDFEPLSGSKEIEQIIKKATEL